MKKHIYAVLIGFVCIPSTWAQGTLVPPGPPGPGMRSLEEIQPRIPIDSLPVVISEAGSYYLTGNLELESGSDAIQIRADHVMLDLMGFTLSGDATRAISLSPPAGTEVLRHIVVRNGTVDGFGTGLRIQGGVDGFYENLQIRNAGGTGLALSSSSSGNMIRRCTITGSTSWAVSMSAGSGSVLSGNVFEDCIIMDNTSEGVVLRVSSGGEVIDNVLRRCVISLNGTGTAGGVFVEAMSGDSLLSGNQVIDCTIVGNQNRGVEIRSRASVIQNNTFTGNTIHGHDNAGILGTSVTSGSGILTGTRIERNAISWNRFNGGIRIADSALTVSDMEIRENVLADNGVGTAFAHLRIEYANRNVIQGNHVSGLETSPTRGLYTANSEGQLVIQNSVFGEPLTISNDDRYGQVIESTPLQNSGWLNFRLE